MEMLFLTFIREQQLGLVVAYHLQRFPFKYYLT